MIDDSDKQKEPRFKFPSLWSPGEIVPYTKQEDSVALRKFLNTVFVGPLGENGTPAGGPSGSATGGASSGTNDGAGGASATTPPASRAADQRAMDVSLDRRLSATSSLISEIMQEDFLTEMLSTSRPGTAASAASVHLPLSIHGFGTTAVQGLRSGSPSALQARISESRMSGRSGRSTNDKSLPLSEGVPSSSRGGHGPRISPTQQHILAANPNEHNRTRLLKRIGVECVSARVRLCKPLALAPMEIWHAYEVARRREIDEHRRRMLKLAMEANHRKFEEGQTNWPPAVVEKLQPYGLRFGGEVVEKAGRSEPGEGPVDHYMEGIAEERSGAEVERALPLGAEAGSAVVGEDRDAGRGGPAVWSPATGAAQTTTIRKGKAGGMMVFDAAVAQPGAGAVPPGKTEVKREEDEPGGPDGAAATPTGKLSLSKRLLAPGPGAGGLGGAGGLLGATANLLQLKDESRAKEEDQDVVMLRGLRRDRARRWMAGRDLPRLGASQDPSEDEDFAGHEEGLEPVPETGEGGLAWPAVGEAAQAEREGLFDVDLERPLAGGRPGSAGVGGGRAGRGRADEEGRLADGDVVPPPKEPQSLKQIFGMDVDNPREDESEVSC